MQTQQYCPDCQAPIPPDAPEGLCPECLLMGALAVQDDITITSGPIDPSAPHHLPDPGKQFGDYRIERILGRGGMGAVYEAEQIETGRRIALKVLAHRLNSQESKARFLREGRLAASINHPNSVYVYGTGEVDDTPVILMELVSGCTLQERVERDGPMPISRAVDAIIDVISGLQAAQAIGILHRDIKPANCFEDADGSVKVGDFGLSLSTEARDEIELTQEGLFLGTPAFCSPEQLRGDGLSVGSDLYSVGVTLFYLLTGRTPFEGKTPTQLLANVLEKAPCAPQDLRPDLPKELATIILRCLEKLPSDRFGNYEELLRALAPFSSEASASATLSQRLLAGLVDWALVSSMAMPITILLASYADVSQPYENQDVFALDDRINLLLSFNGLLILIFYFVFSEGVWGCSIGKAICGMKVVNAHRSAPGFLQAGLRAVVFLVPPALPSWLLFHSGIVQHENMPGMMATCFASSLLVCGLLWSTARQRNGRAGLHDLASRTRVIHQTCRKIRPALPAEDPEPVEDLASAPRIGPYQVLEQLGEESDGPWMLAFDTRLLRKIWIRRVPAGTPEIPDLLRWLGRIGRLRWLSGRRSDTEAENWDAYEAPTGAPFLHLATKPHSWSFVRYWLLDLAEELAAAGQDGTRPDTLSLDRVWINRDGRAKLLDFPAPGINPAEAPPLSSSPSDFLKTVAYSALEGRANTQQTGPVQAPVPLHARKLLEDSKHLCDPASAAKALKAMLHKHARVTRPRRAAMVIACLFSPLFFTCSAMYSMKGFIKHSEELYLSLSNSPLMELSLLLTQRERLNTLNSPYPSLKPVDDRLCAIYISHHFADIIQQPTQWNSTLTLALIEGENRAFAEQALRDFPTPTEEEITQSTELIGKYVNTGSPESADQDLAYLSEFKERLSAPAIPLYILAFALLFLVALPAVVVAIGFRGGLILRAFGVCVVRKDGLPASRIRVVSRSLLTWGPLLLIGSMGAAHYLFSLSLPGIPIVSAGVIALNLAALTAWSTLLPDRSLPDRMAGTMLVPR